LPFLVAVLVLVGIPVVWSAYLSFTSFDGFNPPTWTGLHNWLRIFHDPATLSAFRNVAFLALIFVPLQTGLGLVIALLLHRGLRAVAFLRAIYFLPAISPWMAVGIMWVALFNPEYGVVNALLSAIHMPAGLWLLSPNWWVFQLVVALATTWKGVGYAVVLFMAGLQAIPQELLDAAKADGASEWRSLWRITIPLLSPSTFLVLVLSTIAASQIFDPILALSGGGVATNIGGLPNQQVVPTVLLYSQGFGLGHFGYANTIAWALFIVVAAFVILQRRLESRWVHYER
jgi:multiple sugar transport system permease protein